MVGNELSFKITLDGKEMQVGLQDAGRLLRQFQKNSEEAARSVKRLEDANFSLSTKFRNLVLTLGNLRFALLDVYDVFIRMPVAIVRTAGEMEKLRAQLEGLSTGLTEVQRQADAAADFKFLTNLAQNAPFELQALSEAFVKLKTGGIDPTQGAMQALVDTAAKFGSNSDQLKRASTAIQQILGKGVVSMEELRQQLGEAIPTVVTDLANAMRVSVNELIQLVSTGQVESTSAMNKLIGQFIINNDGAAEKFRETWNGTFAAFKTQLQLTADSIGQAGFLDAVKAVTNDLTSLLSSAEFRSFAVTIGQDLKDIVEAAASVVRTLYEWKDALLALAAGWAIVKLQSSFFKPLVDQIQQGSEKIKAASTAASVAALDQARKQRMANIDLLQSEKDTLNQRVAGMGAIEREQRIAYANLERLGEEHASRVARIRKQIDNLGPLNSGGAVFSANLAERQRLQRALEEEMATTRSYIVQMGAQRDAMERTRTEKLRMSEAADRASRDMDRLKDATDKVTNASRISSFAQNAFAGALDLVGGKLGALFLALQAGIIIWQLYGQSAEKAAEAAARAARGVSTAQDVADARKDLAKAELNLERQNKIVEESTGEQTQRELAALVKADEEVTRLRKDLAERQANFDRTQRQVEADRAVRAIDDQVRLVKDGYDRRINVEKQFQNELQSANRALSKEEENQRIESIKRVQSLSLASYTEQSAVIQGQLTKLREQLKRTNPGTVLAGQLTDTIATLQERGEQLQNNVDRIRSILNPNNLVPKKKKEDSGSEAQPPILTKIETLIAQLKEDQAELEATLPGLLATADKADAAVAVYESIRTKFEQGRFKQRVGDKIVDADLGQVQEAANLAFANARLKSAQDFLNKLNDLSRQLGPDAEKARQFLADPLGGAQVDDGVGRATERVDDLFKSLGLTVDQIAAATNQTIDAVQTKIDSLRQNAATIDLAELTEKIVSQNRDASIEMIEDDQQRNAARLKLDNDLTQKVIQNAITRARANGVSEEQIAKLAIAASNQQSLYEKRLEKNAEGPMERMLASWKNTYKQLQDAAGQWVSSMANALTNFVMTGKLEWRDLANSIISDIIRIQMQAQLAKLFDPGSGGFDLVGTVASFFGFAKGGVMSSAGPLSLKKYAAGGIANSPQLALFGEGSMNEAYVPLPDGRTIPVTMKSEGRGGGFGGNVVVNVINQTGQSVNATQNGPRFDGKQMILDVVLNAAATPGPFREGMRSMMGTR